MADERATLEVLMETAKAARDIDRLGSEFLDAVRDMDRASKEVDFDPASESAKRLEKEVERTARALNRAARSSARGIKEIETATNRVENELEELNRKGTRALSGLSEAGKALVAAFSAAAIADFTRNAVEATLELDRYKIALNAALGSQEAANEAFEFASNEAERLGIALGPTVEGYTKLAAATKGTTLEGQASREIFSSVAEAIRVVGGNAEQTQGALTAIEQIISKGTVSAEELRGQLGERLPGAFRIAAEAIQEEGESLDEATARLNELLQRGELAASDFLPKFAASLRENFGPGLEEAMESSGAQIQRLTNQIQLARAEFGKGFLDQIIGQADEAGKGLEAVTRAASGLGTALGVAVRGVEALIGVMGVGLTVAAAAPAAAISLLVEGITKVVKAAAALVPGLDDAVASLDGLDNGIDSFQEGIKDFTTGAFLDSIRLIEIAIGKTGTAATDTKPTLDEMVSSFDDLDSGATGATGGVTAAGEAVAKLAETSEPAVGQVSALSEAFTRLEEAATKASAAQAKSTAKSPTATAGSSPAADRDTAKLSARFKELDEQGRQECRGARGVLRDLRSARRATSRTSRIQLNEPQSRSRSTAPGPRRPRPLPTTLAASVRATEARDRQAQSVSAHSGSRTVRGDPTRRSKRTSTTLKSSQPSPGGQRVRSTPLVSLLGKRYLLPHKRTARFVEGPGRAA